MKNWSYYLQILFRIFLINLFTVIFLIVWFNPSYITLLTFQLLATNAVIFIVTNEIKELVKLFNVNIDK